MDRCTNRYYAHVRPHDTEGLYTPYTDLDQATTNARFYAIHYSRIDGTAYATVRQHCDAKGDKWVWTVKAQSGRIVQEAERI